MMNKAGPFIAVAVFMLLFGSGVFFGMRDATGKDMARLRAHYAARKNIHGVVERDGRWRNIVAVNDQELTLDDGSRLPLRAAVPYNWVVAYPSGEIVDSNRPQQVPPPGMYFMPDAQPEDHELTDEDLARGNAIAHVSHARSPTHPASADYYATTVKNVGNEDFRVVRFGGYFRGTASWRLNNANGAFYSAQQFRDWYDAPEWLAPGAYASDPTNYGSPNGLWAYEIELRSGARMFVGAVTHSH
jgi:hypothetical protein